MSRITLATAALLVGCSDSSVPEAVPEPSPLAQCSLVVLCRGPLDPALVKMTCCRPYVNKDGHCSCLGVADGCD